MRKIFESKEYLKLKLYESERRNRSLIEKLSSAMAENDELLEDVYRLKETVESYRKQLEDEKIIPNSVTPDFGEGYLRFITFRTIRIDDHKKEMFRKMIEEIEY